MGLYQVTITTPEGQVIQRKADALSPEDARALTKGDMGMLWPFGSQVEVKRIGSSPAR